MFRIKRVKNIPPPAMGGAATHYATAVVAGQITGLTPNVEKAGAFSAEVVAQVKACYVGRENTGKLTFEEIAPAVVVEEKPEPSVTETATTETKPALPGRKKV